MRRWWSLALLLLVTLLAGCGPFGDDEPEGGAELILATTTSLNDSGLLEALLPDFEEQTGYQVKTISVGTGAALEQGANGDADVVLVHSPAAEREWLAAGNGTSRVLLMYNDFVIVGPADDPAGIAGGAVATEALLAIADAEAIWVSRDDDSGTDKLEKQLWTTAGREPSGDWLVTTGQGMGQTLQIANERQGYTITDRGTWLALRDTLDLEILVEGDRALLNVYSIMPVNPEKHSDLDINLPGAEALVAFLTDPETQERIGAFGVDEVGEPLFHPAAGLDEATLGE